MHCISRLPHVVAGVLLGELVERKTYMNESANASSWWGVLTDALSVVLLATAVQAPLVQWYYGVEMRTDISIGLEALLLPLHAVWLAGIVLAYYPTGGGESHAYRECWTRRALSFKPLLALGDVSLVLYCLHLVVLFFYASIYAYVTTGDWHLVPTIDDYTMRVQVPYWHAPAHWALVVSASFLVSRFYEAPARARLAEYGSRRTAQSSKTETASLVDVSLGTPAYNGTG